MDTNEMILSDHCKIILYHLFYVVIKIMRLRVGDFFIFTLNHKDSNIMLQQIESEKYINTKKIIFVFLDAYFSH